VTVISQAEHLTRAVYLCDKLGWLRLGRSRRTFPVPRCGRIDSANGPPLCSAGGRSG